MAQTLWHFCDACDHHGDDGHRDHANAADQRLALGASSDLLRISRNHMDYATQAAAAVDGNRRVSGLITLLTEVMARVTGLEPATFGVTGRRSNQLSYTRADVVRVVRRGLFVCQGTACGLYLQQHSPHDLCSNLNS